MAQVFEHIPSGKRKLFHTASQRPHCASGKAEHKYLRWNEAFANQVGQAKCRNLCLPSARPGDDKLTRRTVCSCHCLLITVQTIIQ